MSKMKPAASICNQCGHLTELFFRIWTVQKINPIFGPCTFWDELFDGEYPRPDPAPHQQEFVQCIACAAKTPPELQQYQRILNLEPHDTAIVATPYFKHYPYTTSILLIREVGPSIANSSTELRSITTKIAARTITRFLRTVLEKSLAPGGRAYEAAKTRFANNVHYITSH
jgi:hypothetical protein